MSGGIDSPVAAWMMMRRGCRIIPLYVALDDILDESNLERAERVVDALRIFQPDLLLVPLKDTYLSRAHNDLLSRGLENIPVSYAREGCTVSLKHMHTMQGQRGL